MMMMIIKWWGGDNQIAITKFINKYSKHPIYGVLLAIYSNQNCAILDPQTQLCKDDNTSKLGVSYNNSVIIMGRIPEVDDKPKALTQDELKDKKVKVTVTDGKKLKYVGEVIDYLAQNVFIPTGFIQHVYVQNDDSWTKLTNRNFNKIKEEELDKRVAAVNAVEKIQIDANEDKVYSESEITKIGKYIETLGEIEASGNNTVTEYDITGLKNLVHQPDDNNGDDFVNVVQKLTIDNITTTNLTEAFTKWKAAMLAEISQAHRNEEEQEKPSLNNYIDKMTEIVNNEDTSEVGKLEQMKKQATKIKELLLSSEGNSITENKLIARSDAILNSTDINAAKTTWQTI